MFSTKGTMYGILSLEYLSGMLFYFFVAFISFLIY